MIALMRALPGLIIVVLISACGSEHGDADAPPAAPSGLAISNVSGGAHLTWADNSDNEDHFMIMRKAGTAAYDDVGMVNFNITQYHDGSVTAGTTYTYQIMAMNSKGEAGSNEVMFTP
jgi:hypothetical protein